MFFLYNATRHDCPSTKLKDLTIYCLSTHEKNTISVDDTSMQNMSRVLHTKT